MFGSNPTNNYVSQISIFLAFSILMNPPNIWKDVNGQRQKLTRSLSLHVVLVYECIRPLTEWKRDGELTCTLLEAQDHSCRLQVRKAIANLFGFPIVQETTLGIYRMQNLVLERVQVNHCFTWKDCLRRCMVGRGEVKGQALQFLGLHWKAPKDGDW